MGRARERAKVASLRGTRLLNHLLFILTKVPLAKPFAISAENPIEIFGLRQVLQFDPVWQTIYGFFYEQATQSVVPDSLGF